MDSKLSRRVALALIEADSVDDIQAVLNDKEAKEWFDDPQHWSPYGNRDKNWDTVGNQQTNPIGALVEIVTNGIDSILLRKAREGGLADMRSPEAPQSMFEAVKRFFPHVVEGKIGLLEPPQRTELARQCMQMAVRRPYRKNHQYPTYTIVDAGDGQLPEDFPKTFLSLSEKNKEGISFVQGKFNMGSTGSLRFCTRSDIRLGHYKLIVSRRPGQQYWGWTLVRVRGPRVGEALPVAEYFHPYGKVIPKFTEEFISAFKHETLGKVTDGTIIKLYEYDIGPGARSVDIGLYNALTVNLIDCALPIFLCDFNADPVKNKGPLRAEGIAARAFGGLNVVLRAEMIEVDQQEEPEQADAQKKTKTEWVHQVEDFRDEDLGRFRVVATAVNRLQDFILNQSARVFYTINGQTHAVERASFLNQRVNLPDLRNHVLINVICDDMSKQALATIFMPDRERKANTDLSRLLEETVIKALKEDDKLRAYAAEIRLRRATEQVDDKGETEKLLQEMVKSDPAIRDLFGLGVFLPDVGKVPGGQEPFKGKKYPTFLTPLNLREEGGNYVKEIPVRGYRRLECGTDANDDYLTRVDSPGETWCSLDEKEMPHSVKLRNGTARFTVHAPKSAVVGEEVEVEFGFRDFGRNIEPLKFKVLVRYTEEEEKTGKPSGKKTDVKEKESKVIGEPEFRWVREEGWSEHNFDADSGAYVATGESTVVHVNHDNRYLKAMRAKEKDDAARLLNENMFKLGLGLLALAIHKKSSTVPSEELNTPIDPEAITRMATAGMAPYIVTVIRRLGGTDGN
ncbi:MAG: hypothetical protein HKUEN07_10050 [Rhodocyclaceae bacterium]|nr:MAG: hypothetical protein HKUEN07_10050 [Rhodocyclaceae bacterium]